MTQQAQPEKVSDSKKGLVIVNTGDGKGKTTAALGLLFRAWGRDMGVRMFQFIKRADFQSGEHLAAAKMGISITALGDGCTLRERDMTLSQELAKQQWENCKEAILAGDEDVIVLDEFTYPIDHGWVPIEEVISFLEQRRPMLHVVITGRGAPQALIDYADLVTEMNVIKHHYHEQSIKAQVGIEL
jgi:cob(I)alamin adenosyltransferase